MLDVIATPVAAVLRGIHAVLSTVLAPGSGPAWALSIVLLTVVVRLLLFPLFVKQIKSQRRMQELAPRLKEIQRLHKGDKETLQAETMKLYRENNANPLSGCLPLLLQLPVFFALFTVIREFKPGASARYGLTAQDLEEGGRARIFGAPISAALNSSAEQIAGLGASVATVRVVAVVMLVLMGATTFWTQRQMMVRAAATTDPTQMQVQKVLLYVLPVSFAVFGYNFPIGVLLYWLTTNVWSMGQQAYVIKRMPPPVLGGSPSAPTSSSARRTESSERGRASGSARPAPASRGGSVALAGSPAGSPAGDLAGPGDEAGAGPAGAPSAGPVPGTARPSGGSPAGRPVAGPGVVKRPQAGRKRKTRKGGRH